MLKAALEALGSGLKVFDVAALVVAFPLATTIQGWLAARPSASPGDAFGAASVLAIVLLATSAWIHQLLSARGVRPSFLDLARPVRTFAIVAAIFAAVVFMTRQHAHSPLLVGLYCAFALALIVGARLGWRAVAAATHRGLVPVGAASSSRSLRSSLVAPARQLELARSLREVDSHPAEHAGAGQAGPPLRTGAGADGAPPVPASRRFETAPAAGAAARGSELVLGGLRSCMDEVSYTPGNPNVLSMTKYLREEGGERAAGPRGDERRIVAEGGDASVSRSDSGEQTVLRIEGVLDAVTAPQIRPAIEALVAERRRSITVELSALRLIDSSGVGLIVSLFKRCRVFGGSVQVSGLKDQPLAIFRLLRLDRIFALP